jgi:hypothetical protein
MMGQSGEKSRQVRFKSVAEAKTTDLICELAGRLDATRSLFGLLSLMVVTAERLSISRRCRMAASLRDAADLIEGEIALMMMDGEKP